MGVVSSLPFVLVPKSCLAKIICPLWYCPLSIITNTSSIPFQPSFLQSKYTMLWNSPLAVPLISPLLYVELEPNLPSRHLMGLSYLYSGAMITMWLKEMLNWILQKKSLLISKCIILPFLLLYLYQKLGGYMHACLLLPSFPRHLHCQTSSALDGSNVSAVIALMLPLVLFLIE